jgi:hypothetical protein
VATDIRWDGSVSKKGTIDESTDNLTLLDWTGRQMRADKRGAIPQDLASILERLHIGGAGWIQLMGQFRRLFRRAAARPPPSSVNASCAAAG